MAAVTVNGLNINYRDTGGDGPPIVLIHGFTGFLDRVASAAPA
jgi:pimeloyl-ACP methyl ester carboxylesterase